MNKSFSGCLKILLINGIIVSGLAGCAVKQMQMTESGFLSGYTGLEESEEYDGMRIYKNPDADILGHYTKVLIAPVQFKLDPAIKGYDLEYADRKKLSDYFHEKLIEGLVENYEIVDEPGEDVLLLRTAITDILPNKVYLNLHWSTTLYGAGIGGASLEAEMVDSLTNERMLAFIDARKGKKLKYTKGLSKWGHTEEVFGLWATIIIKNLDQLKLQYTDDNRPGAPDAEL